MKMKTKLLAACAFLGGMFMASCGEQDHHELWIAYPSQGYSILFADQRVDSISFVTFDSWKINPREEWIKVNGQSYGTINHSNEKRYWITSELEFAQNTTGHSRIGTVDVQSYDYQVGAMYLQFGYLDITHPSPKAEKFYSDTTIPDSVSFCLTADSTLTPVDSLSFYAHDGWEIAYKEGAETEWLTVGKTRGRDGKNSVELKFQENPDTASRHTILLLTSGRVTNEIKVVQPGKKKEETSDDNVVD